MEASVAPAPPAAKKAKKGEAPNEAPATPVTMVPAAKRDPHKAAPAPFSIFPEKGNKEKDSSDEAVPARTPAPNTRKRTAAGELRTTITVSPGAAEVFREILEDQATKKQAAAGRETLQATRRIGDGAQLLPSIETANGLVFNTGGPARRVPRRAVGRGGAPGGRLQLGETAAELWRRQQAAADRLMYNGLAPSSRGAYDSKLGKFADFCRAVGQVYADGSPIVNADTLRGFVAHAMDARGLNWSEGTTKAALSAITTDCNHRNQPNPLADDGVRARILATIKGATREPHQRAKLNSARKNKLPLTPRHVGQLLEAHDAIIPQDERRVFPAFLFVAVTTLARCGNLLTKASQAPSSDRTLALADVHLSTEGDRFDLVLKQTKTMLGGMTVSVTKGASTPAPTPNPWSALRKYFKWRIKAGAQGPNEPFFIREGGSPYTTSRATTTLRLLLAANGDDPLQFSLHGLRHGGATALIAEGAASCEVMSLGGWKSPQMLSTYAGRLSNARRSDLQHTMLSSRATFAAEEGRPGRPAKALRGRHATARL
jgi:hypothetical protein